MLDANLPGLRGTMNELIRLNRQNGIPLHVQLEKQIRFLIHDGTLDAGDVMPTTRAMAEQLGININTVARVYTTLQHKKYLVLRRGVGTFVAKGKKTETKDRSKLKRLERDVGNLVSLCKEIGLSSSELLQFIDSRWEKL